MRTKKYPSDITDQQWLLIKDLFAVYPGGRPRITDLRDVVDAIFYLVRTGCQWRFLPKDFPPKSTVWRYYDEWRSNGTLSLIHDMLREEVRTQEKPTEPTTASIDSQSVDTSEGGEARGRDNAKNVTGRKRHILVDSLGLILAVLVTAADVDDATAAQPLLPQLHELGLPTIKVIYGDSKYHNHALYQWIEANGSYKLIIIRRTQKCGWEKLPIRWVVERTFSWLKKCRRLTVDREKSTQSAEAMIRLAMIQLMLNRLYPKPQQPEFHYRKTA